MTTGYVEYMSMLGLIPDKDAKLKQWATDGVLFADFQWENGFASLFTKAGKPFLVMYYVWSGTTDELMGWIERQVGPFVVVHSDCRGNGHFSDALEPV